MKRHDLQQLIEYPGDIEAELTFIRPENGGRKKPFVSGCRPQFHYDGQDWDAVHQYVGPEPVMPGQTVTTYITFISPEYHLNKLYPGKKFEIREGDRTVAFGRVVRILDLEAPDRLIKPRLPLDLEIGRGSC